jgi:hypothetical protein
MRSTLAKSLLIDFLPTSICQRLYGVCKVQTMFRDIAGGSSLRVASLRSWYRSLPVAARFFVRSVFVRFYMLSIFMTELRATIGKTV